MPAQLEKECATLKETIRHLAHSQKPAADGGGPILPKNSLGKYAGFVVLHTWKTALVAGFEKGHGAVVRIIKGEDGSMKLSAPLFLSTSKFAVGISVGFNHAHTAILIDKPEDVDVFTKPEAVGEKAVHIPNYARSIKDNSYGVHVDGGEKQGPVMLSVSDSYMLVDFSVAGGAISPDPELNKLAYGEAFDPVAILSGSVEAPAAAAEFYAYITEKLL